MQGCKAYRLCSVAVLNELGKEWWIDMKNVQISEELFVAIMRYFMLEQEELLPQIKQGLEKKLTAAGRKAPGRAQNLICQVAFLMA